MIAPHLILVGGFLGAGKTTLLLAAGSRLRAAGKRAGIILNDRVVSSWIHGWPRP